MSDDGSRITEEQLAAYLDGTLDAEAEQALQAMIAGDPKVQAIIDLQRSIDRSLRRQMTFDAPAEDHIQAMMSDVPAAPSEVMPARSPRSSIVTPRRVALLLTAAVVAWIVVAWQFMQSDQMDVVFEPKSLVEIYRETVERGFEPYYECREDDRFAATFKTRQGQPLHLLEMPDDRFMLGLSYSGGLSRNTTAMLCRVDQQPVMVFVDRLANDDPQFAMVIDPTLSIIRTERHDLVFYEVTPVPEKTVTDYLTATK